MVYLACAVLIVIVTGALVKASFAVYEYFLDVLESPQ